MKKIIFTALFSLIVVIFPLIQSSSAAEMSVGLSTWYCYWEALDSDMNLNPGFVFGPAASVRLNDSWSIAGVFLYGKFTGKDKDAQDGGPDEISRFDSDLSLNYNINRYFKIFGGAKFMGFMWDESHSDGTHWSAGPGMGIGSTLPLISNLYFLLNVSGTYSWGKHNQSSSDDADESVNIAERGFNTNASLAYYFATASTSVNLGYRYQYLFIDYTTESEHMEDEAHTFYGITLSFVYSF